MDQYGGINNEGGNGRNLTLAECEDIVEKSCGVPETAQEFINALTFQVPPYIEGMRGLIAGLEVMRHAAGHSCSDCDNPGCYGRPQHQQFYRETVAEEIPKLEAAIASMKKELAMFLYLYSNCTCENCEIKEKKNAAQFN